jgi:hypothetical protein
MRFEKTRSRMVYHATLGLGDFPQQASRWQLLAKGTLLAFFEQTRCHGSFTDCQLYCSLLMFF